MNSSNLVPRTNSAPLRVAVLKLRPVACPNVSFKPCPGPGSGSLGEFIEKINSERSNNLLGELSQEENETYRMNFVFFSNLSHFLLLLPRREHHIPRRHASPFAIFRIQFQVIFQKIVFMRVTQSLGGLVDRLRRSFQFDEIPCGRLIQLNQEIFCPTMRSAQFPCRPIFFIGKPAPQAQPFENPAQRPSFHDLNLSLLAYFEPATFLINSSHRWLLERQHHSR